MLPYSGIVFFGLHLLGMKALVLGRRVEVAGAGT